MPDEPQPPPQPPPLGDPEPLRQQVCVRLSTLVSGTAVALVGGVALAILLSPTRLAGASRSARLVWQQRQSEIKAAIAAEQARPQPPETAAPAPPSQP